MDRQENIGFFFSEDANKENKGIESEEIKPLNTNTDRYKPSETVSNRPTREQWSGKTGLLLACCGFSIGLGNVWRFPFLCYRNGGGAFLIPYFTCAIFGGIPLFFLEVSLGQFMSQGGAGTWKICPLFQGIGIASAAIIFFMNCTYNVLIAWAFYYMFSSFTTQLPWSNCDNEWNTANCSVSKGKIENNLDSQENETVNGVMTYRLNGSSGGFYVSNSSELMFVADPVTEFWERKVLRMSEGIEYPGAIYWDTCLCLLLAWVIVYFCIWKGINSSGKVMYFTVPTPYVLMIILLIRGLTLEGAGEGIKFYLIPDFSKLLDVQVWADAGNQIFYSYAISQGILTAAGSYSNFHHNSHRDSVLFAIANSFTSVLSGFVVFSVLGFMAVKQNVSVKDVAESALHPFISSPEPKAHKVSDCCPWATCCIGPGLAFIAYPEAVAQMPVAPLWSALFFAMLILLGLDSQFGGVEAVITFIVDLNPKLFRRGYRREIIIGLVPGLVCFISFLLGLSMMCEGGIYVFQLFDYFPVSRTIFVVAFSECLVIAYIYGANRYYDCLELMYGFRILPIMKFCWMFGLFLTGVLTYSSLTYNRKSVTYEFPTWSIVIGWIMAAMTVIWIPVTMVCKVISLKGSFVQRLRESIKPILKPHQLPPGHDVTKVRLDNL